MMASRTHCVALVLMLLHSAQYRPLPGNALKEELVLISDCVCPGSNVIFECTVMGGDGFTVWQGSALSCTGNQIILVNRRFTSEGGAFGECNGGSIVGRSVRVEDGYYISQLNVTVNNNVLGRNITCGHHASSTSVSIGHSTIYTTTDSFPQPVEMHIYFAVERSTRKLISRWSPVAPNCPSLHYNILASNCGSCPTTTTNTTVTCTDVPTNGTMCTFAVQTVVCGNIVGSTSTQVSVSFSPTRYTYVNGTDIATNQLCSNLGPGVIVTASVSFVIIAICVAIFTTVTFFLLKTKARLKAELESHKSSTKHTQNYDEVVHISQPDLSTVDTRKNVAYSVHTPKL